MKTILTFLTLITFFSSFAQVTIPTAEVQIKTALMAVPADKRDSAMVYGYNPAGEFIILRKGFNEMISLADNPNEPGFSVACYHKDLDPFMARGRELRKAGITGNAAFEAREQDVKSGKLKMPKNPTTLFVFSASDENYNKTTGEVKDGKFRSVVYIPYATGATTGLPTKEMAPGMPWLMSAGTHAAHIMINPPAKNQD